MTMIRVVAAALASLVASAGVAATVAAPLLPLSEADKGRITASGCNSIFDVGNRTYVFGIDKQLMYRTKTGLTRCTAAATRIDGFIAGENPLVCGSRTLKITKTGKDSPSEATDSNSWPATLTITQGRLKRTMRGIGGVAC